MRMKLLWNIVTHETTLLCLRCRKEYPIKKKKQYRTNRDSPYMYEWINDEVHIKQLKKQHKC